MAEQGETTLPPSGNSGSGTISFDPLEDGAGVEVVDPIERHRYSLWTGQDVTLTPVDVEEFRFPVDAGVAVTTDEIRLPTVVAVYVRNGEGEMIAEAEHFAHEELPAGTYSLEICAPIKLYVRHTGSLTVSADTSGMRIGFGQPTTVRIGARSHHEHPAANVTTSEDPEDMMAALSTLGSGLKTTSPERSYPTLRGHPPMIELGEELEIPDGLAAPETGVQVELPADYESLFVAAPLAYYLGATVVPGDRPRLVTDHGFEHSLSTTRGFEREVERVLKQCFFLDCVTRTEGLYRVDLSERRAVESRVSLDFPGLYDSSLAEQLEAYLAVPFAELEDLVPDWKLTTHVSPDPDSVELLPFVVDDLAVVRTPQTETSAESTVQSTAVNEFMRDEAGAFTRSGSATASQSSFVRPESADSLEQTWVGDGTPVGASKATADAFRHRLDRTPTAGNIDITAVCNDPAMSEERDTVDDVYGSRAELPFDVTLRHAVSMAELRELLTAEADFLHYIGHIDGEGFECADGKLDVSTLSEVSVDAFLLNACQSYEQGMGLLEAGSIGGVVTLTDVINSGAVRIGRAMSRLLNRGFPLQAALDIAKGESIVGGKYIVVGDGGVGITQPESGIPNLCEVESDGESYEVRIKTYPTSSRGMGSLVIPYIEENDEHFLGSGDIEEFNMSKEDLYEFLCLEDVPVKLDGKLRWSSELAIEEL